MADGCMKPQLELRHFAALVALSEAGTIGKAARALGVAQSTLSETLLSLERALQAPVLERHPGSAPRLTKASERLLPHARAILRAMEHAQADALGSRLRMHIGATESLSTWVLPSVLADFGREHPEIDVQVTTDLCDSLRQRLADGQLDLIFTMEVSSAPSAGPPHLAGIIWRKALGGMPLVLVGGPSAPDSLMTDCTTVIHLPDPEGALHDVVARWAAGWGCDARILSAGTLDAVRHHLAVGDGVSVLPRCAVREHLRSASLRLLAPPAPLPDMTAFASARVEGGLRDEVEPLCDRVTQRLGELLDTPVC